METLRSIRLAYRRVLDLINQFKAEEGEVRMLVAYSTVFDECEAVYDAAGRALSRLERLPPGAFVPVDPVLAEESGPGAGRSPASRAAASMAGRRRAASSGPARGPVLADALRQAKDRASSRPADPLSAAAVAASTPWRKPLEGQPFRYGVQSQRPVAPVDFSGPFGQTLPARPASEQSTTQQGGSSCV